MSNTNNTILAEAQKETENEKEECIRCGEKDSAAVFFSTPVGYLCAVCADDMGVTRSF